MNKTLKTALSLFALLTLISCADNQIVSSVINNSSVNPDNSGSIFSSEPIPSSVISSDIPSSVAPSSKEISSTPAPSSEKPSSQVPSSEPKNSTPISSSEPIQSSVHTPSSEPVSSVPVSSAPVQSSEPISSEPVSSSAPISSAPVSSSSEQPSSSTPVGVYYHVTFVNYDETLLYEVDVLEGTEAVYQGEEPTKPEDDDYTYTFKGWDKDLTSITSDTTTMAEYTQKSKWSPIIWF